jgi:tetratricopeptide (TPR) repeat protein
LIDESSYAEALALIKSILAAEPDYAKAHYAWGRIHLHEKDYSSAVQELEAAVRLDPQFLTAWYALGQANLKAGKQEESQRAFERFRQLSEQEREARKSARNRLVVQSGK